MKQKLDDFMICVPTKIFFGKTALDHLAEGIQQYGNRVMIVYGGGSIKKMGLYEKVIQILDENDIFHCELSGVQPNPRVSLIKEGIEQARRNKVDIILPVGGGSVIDTGKGIAAGYFYEGDFWDLAGANITHNRVLPILTILTLPAAGSEMATGCTWVNDAFTPPEKNSFHRPYIRPRISYLNPEFTYSLSPKQTAAGVCDIMSHILESYFSNEKGAYLHARTAEGMLKTLVKYTPIAMSDPTNYEARANIMYCSSWGNNGYIVKGNYVSWSVHLLENPLNEHFNITHGEGLAILTPHWMRWAKRPENLYRYVDLGVNVFGIDHSLDENVIANQAIEAVEDFYYHVLRMPKRLRDIGVTPDVFEECAKELTTPFITEYLADAFVPISYEDAVSLYQQAY